MGDFEKKFPASAYRKKKIACSTNVIESLWEKKGKKYPAHHIARKKNSWWPEITHPHPQELNGRPLTWMLGWWKGYWSPFHANKCVFSLNNKRKSVFCVALDYKKTPDLKKRLRETCRLGFFFYFLHLFIFQAIYIVIQDLKMKMLFVELNIRLQE